MPEILVDGYNYEDCARYQQNLVQVFLGGDPKFLAV